MAQENVKQNVEISVTKDSSTATIGDTRIEFRPNGNVAIYTNQKNLSMTRTTSAVAPEAGMQVSLVGNFRTVAVYGAKVELTADGIAASAPGDIRVFSPANENRTSTAIGAVLKALEVGDHLQDGTVVIAVDLQNNKALFAPKGIFGGKATFDKQNAIPAKMNKQNAHGHSDWRRITNSEGDTLSNVWHKVAPHKLTGSAAPWFWLASDDDGSLGLVSRGGDAVWNVGNRFYSRPVPVVRSGFARG